MSAKKMNSPRPSECRKPCHPCKGRGKFVEKIGEEDKGTLVECSCCDGTGIDREVKFTWRSSK